MRVPGVQDRGIFKLSNKPRIIFGLGVTAEAAYTYLTLDLGLDVAGFTVDRDYVNATEFEGTPVVPFDELSATYSPDDYDLFIAIGYQDFNDHRRRVLDEVVALGYATPSIVHPAASISGNSTIGSNCILGPQVTIGPKASVGDNTFIFDGAALSHHSSVGADCWISPGVTILGEARVGDACFVGALSVVSHSVEVGSRSFVGARALVTQDFEASSVIVEEGSKSLGVNSDEFLQIINSRPGEFTYKDA